jgi:hypothetical protein
MQPEVRRIEHGWQELIREAIEYARAADEPLSNHTP